MSSEKPQYDAERGVNTTFTSSKNPSFMTPTEKFLLFRDCAFVSIILLHLGTTLLAIPTFTTHNAATDTRGCLAVLIFLGVLVPILAVISARDHIRTAKITSAIWFEFGWTNTVMVVDFIVAVAQSSIKDHSKAAVALTWLQTIAITVYVLGFSSMVLLQHKRFPEVGVWKLSVQSVQWLRSPEPYHHSQPPSPSFFISNSNKVIPPWEVPDLQEVKLDNSNYVTNTLSYDPNYVGAHPFWQERVQRQAAVEDDMAYIVQRYGLNLQADKRSSNKPNGTKHAKKLSIRDLEISRPVPVASTVRRANTLAGMSDPRYYAHKRGGSLQTSRGTPSLHLDIPKSTLDVPVDAVSIPEPVATKAIHVNKSTRALGLAGRTLIGTSRPKASASRQHAISSKPLPSPPAVDDSDESMKSLLSAQGSSSFVMAMAHKVQISASKVRPLMISTPKATETPISPEEKPFW